jgi:Phosphoribosylaminoimidazole carboxylase (NCAIR synthetase)
LLTPVVMVNLLGQHVQPALELLASAEAARTAERFGVTPKLHLYGKREAKPQRKMGHINVLAERPEQAIAWIESAGVWNEEVQIYRRYRT